MEVETMTSMVRRENLARILKDNEEGSGYVEKLERSTSNFVEWLETSSNDFALHGEVVL
jgi:hypothetical protein